MNPFTFHQFRDICTHIIIILNFFTTLLYIKGRIGKIVSKKYKPKISDCNILRNLLLYGKYGYNLIFQKRNTFLTSTHMEEIFISRFLNNLSLSDKEKNHILNNTLARVQVIDTVRGNDIFCNGKIAEDLR